ncbi:eIF-2-alpha kinase activator GCN1-like [Hippocampus comes]|uniref:eIF-2-alpha kinase activator GCN1-like n=1 Tax=Hippocampus comes TaxID=109280 RepID=UPI00094E9FAC|nr:PREDICTED: eIF-2-alpha kinase activator GCN1-like [Hippocampus comes]
MLGVCLDFCTSQKDKATIDKHKGAMLDLYIKMVLMSKTKTHQHILDKSGSLLRHVSHSEFKELLLPSIQKTMLRSPENAMQAISCLLSALTIDLSQYAMDIGKAIASQLKANNAQLMDEAIQALQNLARQCSDSNAVQDIVTHLFKILGGSEGKLTVVTQKMSVLSGIGSCSHHAVSGGSSQTLSSAVTVMFIPYLQQEGILDLLIFFSLLHPSLSLWLSEVKVLGAHAVNICLIIIRKLPCQCCVHFHIVDSDANDFHSNLPQYDLI